MQQAQYLAHLILRWHQEFGKKRIHQLPPDIAQRYLAKITYFQAHQPSASKTIREIADEQIKGVFEHFYNEKLPSLLLDQSSQNIANESLGNIAHLIRQWLREEELSQKTSHIFSLPKGWQERIVWLYPSSINLLQKQGETKRQTLSTYFAPLADMKDVGVGGKELMVSMNEDLLDGRDNVSNEDAIVTAYGPASFDFQLATGEDSLVTHVLRGDISIIQVILGYDSSNIESYKQEV